ncbi:hypothetical protein [Sporosarcina sp. ITBMC105]
MLSDNNPVMLADHDGENPLLIINISLALYDGYKVYSAGGSKKEVAAAVGMGLLPTGKLKGIGKAVGFVTKGHVKQVSNMNEFFGMEFGKTISSSLSKSKVKYDGQSLYKVEKKTDNQYLKKGYGVYLDALHKDHLEVIDKKGNLKYVLNLDGTLNPDKTKKALGRVVKGW